MSLFTRVATRLGRPAFGTFGGIRSLITMKDGAKQPLSAYARLELLEQEIPEKVRRIWLQHHAAKPCISAVIPVETAKILSTRLEANPDFIIPVPSDTAEGGYSVLYQQSVGNVVQYTSVEEYTSYKEQARPFLNLFFYDDCQSKGLVLMRG